MVCRLFQNYVYFWWVDFQIKNRCDIFGNKISTRFFVRVTKYRVDFLYKKYWLDFCVSCKISGRFFDTKHQADICTRPFGRRALIEWLEIISTPLERVCLYTSFVLRIQQTSLIVDWYQTNLWDARIKLWLVLSVWKWMPKGVRVYCRGSCCTDTSQSRFDTNQQSTESINSSEQNLYKQLTRPSWAGAYNLQSISTLRPRVWFSFWFTRALQISALYLSTRYFATRTKFESIFLYQKNRPDIL